MATFRFDPNQRIPNDPFYSPMENWIPSGTFNLVVGSGIYIDYARGIISASGSGPGGLSVISPITNTGSLSVPVIGILTATLTQRGAVQPGSNIDVLGGVISVKDASIFNSGVVQLNNTTTSTSTLQALTAAQGKYLQDQINALTLSSNISFAGTFAVQTGTITATTTAGATAGFAVGSNLPFPTIANADYFVIIADDGVYTPPGSITPVSCTKGDWFLSNGVIWQFLDVGASYPAATTTTAGVVRLATPAETAAGLDPTIAVTPFSLSTGFVPKAAYTSKGDILAASGASSPVALPLGVNGSLLTADSTCLSGVKWQSGVYIPCSCITAKGALITGLGAASPTPLAIGTNGQVLTVDFACATGLKWGAVPTTGTVTTVATGIGLTGGPIITNGTIALANTTVTPGSYANATLTVDQQGRLSFAAAGTAPIPLACLTAKGALVTATAANTPITLSVGSNGQVLTADGACAGGIKWNNPTVGTVTSVVTGTGLTGGPITSSGTISLATSGAVAGTYSNPTISIDSYGRVTTAVSGASYVQCTQYSAKGAILAGISPGIPSVLALGSDGLVLTADSTCVAGLKWAASTGGSVTQVNTGTGLSGGPITSTGTIALSNTAVIAGTYTNTTLTVDGQGRLSFATSGAAPVPLSVFTGKGQVLAGTGVSTAAVTAAGVNGQILTADSTSINGVGWCNPLYIPCAQINSKGALITGSAANTPFTLSPGSDGQVLVADSACSGGLKWASGTGSVTSVATGAGLQGGPITSSGTISLTNTGVTAGTYTYPGNMVVDSQGRITSVVNLSSPVFRTDYPAKGSLLTASAAGTISALAVGANSQVLMADSTCVGGLKWAAAGGGGSAATPTALGTVYGCSNGSTGGLTAVGYGALQSISGTAVGNVAIGDYASANATTQSYNTAVGSNSQCNGGGNFNTSVGASTLRAIAGGFSNSALGASALAAATSGFCNVAIGSSSLAVLTTGYSNTAVGTGALSSAIGNNNNVAVGAYAAGRNTTGSFNVAIGNSSLCDLTSGAGNVAVGDLALRHVTTGINNVGLGDNSGGDLMCCITTGSNIVVLGNCRTTTIVAKTNVITVSDIRWKKVKGEVPLALPFVKSLTPITYQFCDAKTGEVTDDRYRYGFSAQEIVANEINPEHPVIARTENAEMISLNETMLLPVLVNALKELSAKVDDLQTKLDQLQKG